MRRPRFGSVIAAVAVATAGVIPLFAAPAAAVNACGAPGGIFPMTPGAQAGWKIDCTTNAGTKVDNIIVSDSGNGYWQRGAARKVTATTTAASANITLAVASSITAADLRRPVSGGCIAGGAYVKAIVSTTVITLSKVSGATGCGAGTSVTIEYTSARVLQDATCTAAGVVTSTNGIFTAADAGKSVSGGPFSAGARIQAAPAPTATTVTVKLAAGAAANTVACTAPETLTIGGAVYSPTTGSTVIWNSDPMGVHLQNSTANGQAFTCAGSVLTPSAVNTTPRMGTIVASSYIKLPVVILVGATTTVRSIISNTATAFTLNAACPAGVTATVGTAAIGQPGANAPRDGNSMASLAAAISLNPALVSTSDDCAKNTYEGFQVVGTWKTPMNAAGTLVNYTTAAVVGAPVAVSTGQILFPTSVVSFAAYIRPQRTGGLAPVVPAGSHFEFVFPSLPTTLAVCLTAGSPTNATALAFGLAPTTLSTTPAVPTGAGNSGSPGVHAIGPQTGATSGRYQLKNAAVVVATGALPTCTIVAATVTPAFTCGDG